MNRLFASPTYYISVMMIIGALLPLLKLVHSNEEVQKVDSNEWDWTTTRVLAPLVQVPRNVCGQGSSEMSVEDLPPQNQSKLQQIGDCRYPENDQTLDPLHLLLKLSTTWQQLTPWNKNKNKPDYQDVHIWTDGWSMLPSNNYGCLKGGYCSYACKAPFYETQFDNFWGQGGVLWSYPPDNSFIGYGRRYLEAAKLCAGGQQGIYCNLQGQLELKAPSTEAPQKFKTMCTQGPDIVVVENKTPWKISSCRKVLPEDYMGIPTAYPANSSLSFPTVANGEPLPENPTLPVPMYWTYGAGPFAVGFKQYFTIPELNVPGYQPCLQPWCQKVVYRPSLAGNISGIEGQDYTPFEVDVSAPSLNGDMTVHVRITSVASATGFPIKDIPSASYDTSLGNPGYGIRLYDQSNQIACDAYWEGNLRLKPDCSTHCVGMSCADPLCDPNQSNPDARNACYNPPPPKAPSTTVQIKPILKKYGVIQDYKTPDCYVLWSNNSQAAANTKIRIELYPLDLMSMLPPQAPSPSKKGNEKKMMMKRPTKKEKKKVMHKSRGGHHHSVGL